jgi:hypothetical protein
MILLSEQFTDLLTLNSVNFFVPKLRFPLHSKDRVDFIEKHIYNNRKDFYNWIELENEFKLSLNQVFYSVHTIDHFNSHPDKKIFTLLVNTDVDLACKHSFKLHPFWNGNPWKKGSKEQFIKDIQKCNDQNINYVTSENEKVLRISSDCLNNTELDKDFYDTIINFLELDNQYDNAYQIHKMWKNVNCKAEQNIVKFFNTHEYPSLAWYDGKFHLETSDVYNRDDWNNMKQTTIQYYGEV